jgi:hypothetical protein
MSTYNPLLGCRLKIFNPKIKNQNEGEEIKYQRKDDNNVQKNYNKHIKILKKLN